MSTVVDLGLRKSEYLEVLRRLNHEAMARLRENFGKKVRSAGDLGRVHKRTLSKMITFIDLAALEGLKRIMTIY